MKELRRSEFVPRRRCCGTLIAARTSQEALCDGARGGERDGRCDGKRLTICIVLTVLSSAYKIRLLPFPSLSLLLLTSDSNLLLAPKERETDPLGLVERDHTPTLHKEKLYQVVVNIARTNARADSKLASDHISLLHVAIAELELLVPTVAKAM